ncbi:MAG TPA: ferrous iron transport protein B [Syntrophomonadaceae bacterium]|nr:ferrous iron transport protein B [Syntrophomonadaceae bacterium]
MSSKKITIALAGNPNSGKTTLFNILTGARQHVGNYPGVTVERKEGRIKHDGYDIKIIDLPGTYGLTAYSPDELVARNVLLEEELDLVVDVVDASNLERNLYLTMQLKELEIPMVLAVNMADYAEANGITINYDLLAQLIGIPVVRVVATKGEGLDDLLDLITHKEKENIPEKTVRYKIEIEEAIARIEEMLNSDLNLEIFDAVKKDSSRLEKYPSRWLAIKLLEEDKEVTEKAQSISKMAGLLDQVKKDRESIELDAGDDLENLIAEGRYAYIRGACQEAVKIVELNKASKTERIDKVLLNRITGLPIFFFVMWLLFQLTFALGNPIVEYLEDLVALAGVAASNALSPGLLNSLISDGIIGGVGGVVVFLPVILLLFLGIAILEATGYMSRAAFLMDKIMHKVGLHGKSFVPMLIGFGCTIPAIMATRTLENPKDRLVTMLVTPLMSCGAKLPVYTLLIAAFFPNHMAGNILFSIYIIGILLALIMAKVFRTWLVPGESEPFVMELPVYRMPKLKSVAIQMWERAWLYLRKAGTIILAFAIVVWALFTFPMVDSQGMNYASATEQMENSYAGRLGKTIEPVIAPIGFEWKTGVALIAGFAAKEIVVSTMATLYSMGDADSVLEGGTAEAKSFAQLTREQSGFNQLTAFVLMLFILIYVPCMATIAVIKNETNSWRWPIFTIGYTVSLAWVVCFVVYQGGMFLGIGV